MSHTLQLDSLELPILSYALDGYHTKVLALAPGLAPEHMAAGLKLLDDVLQLRVRVARELVARHEQAEALRKD